MPTTTTAMELATVLDRVLVNARCAPITSLLSRETSAPVWVRVKNASDWRWTCPNTRVRRSKIRPSPIREDSQPPMTLSTALNSATPAIASASQATSRLSPLRMPSSTIRCTSSGMTTTIAASTTVRPRKAVISRRCGPAKPTTRRTVPPVDPVVRRRSGRNAGGARPRRGRLLRACSSAVLLFCLLHLAQPAGWTHQGSQLTEPAGLCLSLEPPLRPRGRWPPHSAAAAWSRTPRRRAGR